MDSYFACAIFLFLFILFHNLDLEIGLPLFSFWFRKPCRFCSFCVYDTILKVYKKVCWILQCLRLNKKYLSLLSWFPLTISDPYILWFLISMDFVINLTPFSSYDSILVVVDHLTKMVHFILCTKTITSEGTAKLFLDHVFWYHGLLENIYIFFITGFNLHPSFGSDSLSF